MIFTGSFIIHCDRCPDACVVAISGGRRNASCWEAIAKAERQGWVRFGAKDHCPKCAAKWLGVQRGEEKVCAGAVAGGRAEWG